MKDVTPRVQHRLYEKMYSVYAVLHYLVFSKQKAIT
jgi:hypothetical protein